MSPLLIRFVIFFAVCMSGYSVQAQTIQLETNQTPNASLSTAADPVISATFHNTTPDTLAILAVGMNDPESMLVVEVRDPHGNVLHRKRPPTIVPHSTSQANSPRRDLKPGDIIPPDDPELRSIELRSSRYIFIGPGESHTFKYDLRDLYDLSKTTDIDVVVSFRGAAKTNTQSNSLHLKLAK